MTTPTNWITFDMLPPPRSARLSMSAKRDSAKLECVFSGFIPVAELQRTVTALYAGQSLWKFGADEVEYDLQEGQRITKVTFRIGPYRYGKRVRYAASYYLYRILTEQLGNLITRASAFAPGMGGTINRDMSTEVAYWRYVLAGGLATPPGMSYQLAQNNDIRDELITHINMKSVAVHLKYDDVVRDLFDHWMLMVRVDPSYLDGYTDAQLLTDWDAIPAPRLFLRSCLDQVALHFPTAGQVPIIDDKRLTWPLHMTLREKEDTMLQFWYDGRDIPDNRLRQEDTGRVNLITARNYWRYERAGNTPIDWTIGTAGIDNTNIVSFTSVNPWTLYSPVMLPSLDHAHLESHIAQQQNFLPNRTRRVTAIAPESAAELRQLIPGMPVEVSSTNQQYWITELNISTPPLTMNLELVHPGRVWDADLPADVSGTRTGVSPLDDPLGELP